ncbi:hypothetical protein CDD83_2241 [Cordyceps sp. RAO-2017]|nr:hypothetical protein CDD83_2241 [Cordyceps sp. RAO-2017]
MSRLSAGPLSPRAAAVAKRPQLTALPYTVTGARREPFQPLPPPPPRPPPTPPPPPPPPPAPRRQSIGRYQSRGCAWPEHHVPDRALCHVVRRKPMFPGDTMPPVEIGRSHNNPSDRRRYCTTLCGPPAIAYRPTISGERREEDEEEEEEEEG